MIELFKRVRTLDPYYWTMVFMVAGIVVSAVRIFMVYRGMFFS